MQKQLQSGFENVRNHVGWIQKGASPDNWDGWVWTQGVWRWTATEGRSTHLLVARAWCLLCMCFVFYTKYPHEWPLKIQHYINITSYLLV